MIPAKVRATTPRARRNDAIQFPLVPYLWASIYFEALHAPPAAEASISF